MVAATPAKSEYGTTYEHPDIIVSAYFDGGPDILEATCIWNDDTNRWEYLHQLREGLEFERGKDPGEALKIGLKNSDKVLHLLRISEKSDEEIHEILKDPWKVMDSDDRLLSVQDRLLATNYNIFTLPYLLKGYKGGPDERAYHKPSSFEYVEFQGKYYRLKKDMPNLVESSNFERGKDPKEAMNIGMAEKLEEYIGEVNPTALRDSGKVYWLQICAEGGRNDLVEYLLLKGFNPDMNDGAPLKLAASYGKMDVVKTLVKYGAVIDRPSESPVWTALLNDHFDIAEYLLQNGAKFKGSWNHLLDNRALLYPILSKYFLQKKKIQESIDFTRGEDPLDSLQIGKVQERKDAAFNNFLSWFNTAEWSTTKAIENCWDSPYRFFGDEDKERLIFNGMSIAEIKSAVSDEFNRYRDLIEAMFGATYWASEIAMYEDPDSYKLMNGEEKDSFDRQIEDEYGSKNFLDNLLKYFIDIWPVDKKIKS